MRESRSSKARSVPTIASDLRLFRIFQHCDPGQLTRLAGFAQEETAQADQLIYRTGDRGTDFFVLLAGGIEAFLSTSEGYQAASIMRVGQLFGEVSFLDGRPRETSAKAIQPTALLRFDGSATRRAVNDDPELAVGLTRAFWHSLAAKIRQANQYRLGRVGESQGSRHAESDGASESVDLKPRAKLELFRERGLSAAELCLLATTLPGAHFAPETHLFFEGDKADAMYIVVDGEVVVSRRKTDGGDEELAVVGRGEVLGELALVDDQTRSADGRAGSQGCTVLVLSQQDLNEVLSLQPLAVSQFLHLVGGVLCRRLRVVIEGLGGGPATA